LLLLLLLLLLRLPLQKADDLAMVADKWYRGNTTHVIVRIEMVQVGLAAGEGSCLPAWV